MSNTTGARGHFQSPTLARALLTVLCALPTTPGYAAQTAELSELSPGVETALIVGPATKAVVRFVATVEGMTCIRIARGGEQAALEVHRPDGALVGHSIGLLEPFVLIDTTPGMVLKIGISFAADASNPTPLEVLVVAVEAPETEATREAAAEILSAVQEIGAFRTESDSRSARRALSKARRLLRSVEGAAQSYAVANAANSLGSQAGEMRLFTSAATIWAFAHARLDGLLPTSHPKLMQLKSNLAAIYLAVERHVDARELIETVRGVYERTCAPDDPDLLNVQFQLSQIAEAEGRLEDARQILEHVLSVYERTMAEESRDVQVTRGNLGNIYRRLEMASEALALFRRVNAFFERTLPYDHPDLQLSRSHLAGALRDFGDAEAACALLEKVLAVYEETLPMGHPRIAGQQLSYAAALGQVGLNEQAEEIARIALEALRSALPMTNTFRQSGEGTLGNILMGMGKFGEAREIFEDVLEAQLETLPAGDPGINEGRQWLASVSYLSGDGERAYELLHEVRASQGAAATTPFLLRSLTWAALVTGRPDEARKHALAYVSAALHELGVAERLASPERIAAYGTRHLGDAASTALSLAAPSDESDALRRAAFRAVESARGASTSHVRLRRLEDRASTEVREELAQQRAAYARATRALEAAAGAPDAGDVAAVAQGRDAAAGALQANLASLEGAEEVLATFDVAACAAKLREGEVAIGFHDYLRLRVTPEQPIPEDGGAARLAAFVVTPDARFEFVDLGDADEIQALVSAWRTSLGVPTDGRGVSAESRNPARDLAAAGAALREAVLDPIVARRPKARRLICALENVLHMVPLDALPGSEGGAVGDLREIVVVESLRHLRGGAPPTPSNEEQASLVVMGGVNYGVPDEKGPPLRRLAPLAETSTEAGEVAALFRARFGQEAPLLRLAGDEAKAGPLAAGADGARYLHLATHGWFAPDLADLGRGESQPGAPAAAFAPGVAGRTTALAPLTLCGLALAGCNTNAPGSLITAESLSGLDLSRCQLAVLSACETNVGIRRSGRGILSLQRGLLLAGARHTLTSLWKVPDTATRELMAAFYLGIWTRGETKRQSLWNAKCELREATGQGGGPLYTARDWAGWVLVGDPEDDE